MIDPGNLTRTDDLIDWDWRVQYQESDRNFVARILEDEGVYYDIERSADSHSLVLMDDSLMHPKGYTVFNADGEMTSDTLTSLVDPRAGGSVVGLADAQITSWKRGLRVLPTVYESSDWRQTSAALDEGRSTISRNHGLATMSNYVFADKLLRTEPTDQAAISDTSANVLTARRHAVQAGHDVFTVETAALCITAGHEHDLVDVPAPGSTTRALVTSVTLVYEADNPQTFNSVNMDSTGFDIQTQGDFNVASTTDDTPAPSTFGPKNDAGRSDQPRPA